MFDPTTKTRQHDLVDREFHNLRELFEMLMSEMSPSDQKLKMRPNLGWAPPDRCLRHGNGIVVTMDIAGMDLKEINVFTDGNVVTIRGVRKEITPRCKKQFHAMEIRVGPFQRHIEIPVPSTTRAFTRITRMDLSRSVSRNRLISLTKEISK